MKRTRVHHKAKHAIRHVTHSPHHDTKTAKVLKRSLLAFTVILVVTSVVLSLLTYSVERRISRLNAQSKNNSELLESVIVSPEYRRIHSSLGFSLVYDTVQYNATAKVSTDGQQGILEEVTGTTLDQTRAYRSITIRPNAITTLAQNAAIENVRPQLKFTALDTPYMASRASGEDPNTGALDIVLGRSMTEYLSVDGVESSEPTDVLIAGVPYKRVVLEKNRQIFGQNQQEKTIVYLAVQGEQPYSIEIGPISSEFAGDAALYEKIIESIRYSNTDESKLTLKQRIDAKVAGLATAADLPTSTTVTPYTIDTSTIFNVILKNQPAVVRVATARCADIDLLLPNGTVGLQLDGACAAYVGSGSFVSSDGYIATNGHVTTVNPANIVSGYSLFTENTEQSQERLVKILKYMIAAQLTTEAEARALLDSASKNDSASLLALSTLGNFIPDNYVRVSNNTQMFAVQTSVQPIRFDTTTGRFTYNDTVLSAKLVAKNFDDAQMKQNMYAFGTGSTSDVALLKAEGTFPVVSLGSKGTLATGDSVTAIGFPAFTDGGLSTKKSKTPPTATQGKILKIEDEQTSGLTLIYTDVPIAQGNSGGPAFASNGKQIGLTTYSIIECADHECFGDGVARDVGDFTGLLAAQKVSLQTSSPISELWQEGLEQFSNGNYRASVKTFETVAEQYPAHYLAESLSNLAISRFDTELDTSDTFATTKAFSLTIATTTIAVLVIGGTLIVFLVRGSLKHGLGNHYRTGKPAPLMHTVTQDVQSAQDQTLSIPVVSSAPAPVIITPTNQYEHPEAVNEYPPHNSGQNS